MNSSINSNSIIINSSSNNTMITTTTTTTTTTTKLCNSHPCSCPSQFVEQIRITNSTAGSL